MSAFIDLPPIPVDSGMAALQARELERRIADAGSVAAAARAAAQAVLDASPADPPSELNRLRLLYRHAYTVAELERLALNTFADLGLAPRPV